MLLLPRHRWSRASRLFVAALVAALVGLATGGCAEVAGECAGALLEVTAQVCVDVLCDTDNHAADDDDADISDEEARERRRVHPVEVAPPQWQPREGSCDVARDADGGVHVACPDGTRAWFTKDGGDPRELVESEAPPAGSCRSARVLRQGIDVDDDGALSPSEVTGRTTDCDDESEHMRAQTLEGHLAIHGPDDVARLSGRRALSGGLLVKSASLVRLELPSLQSIGATLRVDGASALEMLTMPHLAGVGGDVVIARDPRLVSVSVPMLSRVGGGLVLVENPQWADADVQSVIERLSRHGFAGPVDLTGTSGPVGAAPPSP